MPQFAGYEVERMMVLSTSHLTKEDNEKLLKNEYTALGCFWSLTTDPNNGGEGFLVHCAEDFQPDNAQFHKTLTQDLVDGGWSVALAHIQIFALEHHCTYIRLDPDGMVVPELPTYDWEA
jgi:hypothetical protein